MVTNNFSPEHPPLITIVGPTAVGKTALAVRLAETLGAEIVSADSRQIYRKMDIGTAKPSAAELRRAPHHLINIVDPDEILTLAQYQTLAYEAIDHLHSQGKVPFLVGGTGLYVRAVVEGYTVPEVPPQPALRRQLEREAALRGTGALHARLSAVDPEAAGKIDPRNIRRVVRALEVYETTGQPISELQRKTPPPYHIVQIGLTLPREVLYERIDRRVDRMITAGLIEEVRKLADAGYGWELPSLSALGYAQIGAYLRGECTLDEAVSKIKRDTRRFVHRQYTWFRLNDTRIHWFSAETDPFPQALAVCRRKNKWDTALQDKHRFSDDLS
ncbi:MAG: tRNA (adenosine(37)-N6)-dimethylallyltransferase MiaA [Chloroflexi bacterium]|nr:tRNA (adenosine(37)-N6)-dimethylallyltransferase MiaA [Chloroflexota bacterium]